MAYIVLLAIPLLLAALITDVIPASIAFFSVAFIFQLLGIIDLQALLGSFANPTLITLVILLLVSIGLERTTFVRHAANKLISKNEIPSAFRLVGLTALLSAFINNTAVVSAFTSAIARQKNINPSKLLIPLSYASILGGITTLIGTSTNLIVNSFVVASGHEAIHMFTFTLVGLPIALICLPLLVFLSKRLPARATSNIGIDKSYFISAIVKDGCDFIGKTIRDNGLLSLDTLSLLEIERNGKLISPVGPLEIIHPGDFLVFTGSMEQINKLQEHSHLEILGEQIDDLLSSNLIEVVIAKDADIINRPLKQIDFRTLFDAGVVGVRRHGRRLRGRIDQIRLKVGDNLVLATGPDFHERVLVDKNFHLLDQRERAPQLDKKHSILVVIGFIAAIACATFGIISLFNALILLLGFLLVSKCLNGADLKFRYPFELMIIIGSSLAISKAMMDSGASDIIGHTMQDVFSHVGVYGALVGVLILSIILTETVTNNAAAAIMMPIALSTAHAYQVNVMPFVMSVAYGASACFIMPYGYQTHLLVLSPGQYRLRDFMKTGLPITLVYAALAIILVPVFFPL